MLSDAQVQRFRHDGFVVLEDFVDTAACATLRDRAIELVDAWEPGDQRSVFTTDEQSRTSTTEFLDSASGIWCFFEADAFGPDGGLRQATRLSINKIGHAQHDLDPAFESFTYTPRFAEVVHDIGLHDAMAVQSMYIFKQPGIGGEVGCHQDATFLYTDPISVTGFWFAIEDATVDNGCLWAAPGGHRTPLRTRFERVEPDAGLDDLTRFRVLDPAPLPSPPDDLVPLEVSAGTLVLLDGLLPHWSDVNHSATSRHAYTVHCISAAAHYPAANWLQRSAAVPLRRVDDVVATRAVSA